MFLIRNHLKEVSTVLPDDAMHRVVKLHMNAVNLTSHIGVGSGNGHRGSQRREAVKVSEYGPIIESHDFYYCLIYQA